MNMKSTASSLLLFAVVVAAGCKDNSQPPQVGSTPVSQGSSASDQGATNHAQPAASTSTEDSTDNSLVEQEKHLALTNITANFELSQYSLTVARAETKTGKWVVIPTTENCDSDETCFDVLFRMNGTPDVPGWHFEFDQSTGMINKESDIDESLNNKYFIVAQASRGGGDSRP